MTSTSATMTRTPAGRQDRAAPRVRRTDPRRAQWSVTLSTLLLLLVSAAGLVPILRGFGWWWMMAFVAGVIFITAALLLRVGVIRWLVPAALVGVLVGMLTLFFGAGTGLLWVIPTPQTVGTFESLVADGRDSIFQQSVPAEVTPGILFFLVAGSGVIAIVMHTLAVTLRSPALAGAPALVPLIVPGLIQTTGAIAFPLVLAAVAYLVVLRVDVKRRRDLADSSSAALGADARVFVSQQRRRSTPVWGTLSVGAAAVVSALLLSTAAPALIGDSVARSGSNALLFGSGVSPMINLGQDLRRPDAGPVLSYRTTAERRSYFTLLTLDSLEGQTWTARLDGVERSNTVDSIARPPGLGTDVASTPVETAVVIDGVNTRWLPLPARTVSVSGLKGSWHWDNRTRAVASTRSSTLGQAYTATALEVTPTAEQLRASGQEYPSSIAGNLELPTEMPAGIAQTARDVTMGAGSGYDAAVALQSYFTNGTFIYDTASPVDEGYDGGGLDVVNVFLEKKRGYCVHFASAMAVMARTLGIPSRIALGYLPGIKSQDLEQGLGQYNIDSHDLHSWPELYFAGVGWVPFEPTPGRGTIPNYELPTTAATPTGVPAGAAPTAAPRPQVNPLAADNQPQADAIAPTPATANVFSLTLAAVLAAVLLLLAPAAARILQRGRRLRLISSGAFSRRAASMLAWQEVSDSARDHGFSLVETDTPRALATRLAQLVGVRSSAAPALDRLLVGLERVRFDRSEQDELARDPQAHAELGADLAEVTRAVAESVAPGIRWRARLMPRSLATSIWAKLNRLSPGNA